MMKKLHDCSWSFLRATKSFDKQISKRCFTCKSTSGEIDASISNSVQVRMMPESRGPPVLGLLSWLISSSGGTKLHEYVDQKHKELGPVYRDCVGPVRAVFINSPDEYKRIFRLEGPTPKHYLPEAFNLYNQIRNCRRGLLFMEGQEWLHYRRILNKILLAPDPIITMGPSCQIVAELLVKRWAVYANQNSPIPDLEDQLYQWSIEAMLAILVGPSAWKENSCKIEQAAEKLAKVLHNMFFYSVRLSSMPAKLAMRLKLPWWTKFVQTLDDAMDILRVLVIEMIQWEGDGILKIMEQEGIHGQDLFRIVADLIIAAGDTTAFSMQWTLFLLASHSEQQDKIYDCVKDLNYSDILRNQLMKGIVKESLRLYPTAPFIARFMSEDNTILDYKVNKDELLILSMYSSSRDPKNFVRPNEFIPERWIRTNKGDYESVLTPNATLPFAMGGRSCIGKRLAETQLSLTITELVKNYKMKCINQERIKLKLHLISVPSEPIHITLSKK